MGLAILAFTAVISALTGVLFASVPAWRASRVDMSSFGRQDLGSTRHALGGSQPGKLLVIVQVALSLLLLIGAGLFLRSLRNLNVQQADLDRSQGRIAGVFLRIGEFDL